MRRIGLIAILACMLISPALGVVGHNNSGDGRMGITSGGSSASATTAVGPNGTDYTAKVSMDGRTQNDTEDSIESETISSSKVEFNGTIRASTPCHVIEHEISETEDGYVINIKTVKDELDGQACTQQIVGINYNAEFEAETGFSLEVQHNGQTVETYETVSDKGKKNKDDQKSFIQRLFSFLGL